VVTRIIIPGLRDLDAPGRVETVLLATCEAWSVPDRVLLDFTPCRAMTPAGASVIALLKLYRNSNQMKTEIDWSTMLPAVRLQLARWRILNLFQGGYLMDAGRSVPLLVQPSIAPTALVNFLQRWVMPRFNMSAALQKEIRKAFCEVLNNIFQHAESPVGGIVIGRLYPLATPRPRLHLCVADRGVGLVRRVQGASRGLENSMAAIQWALKPGNSTRRGPDPPGLGLYLLQEFVTVNEGSLFISANDTWYHQVAGAVASGHLASEFPGTLIELRLYVRDDVSYDISYD